MKNVLLIDSGSGGVNILKECVKVCPYCNFLMFCDDANLPYGNKTKRQLQEITLKNLQNIRRFFKFDIVILACNTLTCTCLDFVRKKISDVIFIGTVPAVKPALEKFDESEILVLATQVTLKHNVLIQKHPNLKKLCLPSLASDIDSHLDELESLKDGLKEEFNEIIKKQGCPKSVVFGCTHYVAVKDILQEILGEDVQFFDSMSGVARRLLHFVSEQEDFDNKKEPDFKVQLMVSGKQELLAQFWNYYISN